MIHHELYGGLFEILGGVEVGKDETLQAGVHREVVTQHLLRYKYYPRDPLTSALHLTDLLQLRQLVLVCGLQQSQRPRVEILDLASVHILEHVPHCFDVDVLRK